MKVFLKYLLWLLSLVTLVIFYFLGTESGHQTMGYFLGEYLSKKTSNKVEVMHLGLKNYPQIILDVKLNSSSVVHLEGKANTHTVDMDYHLKGTSYRWNNFKIDSPIDVNGHLKGVVSNFKVSGRGTVFDGHTNYQFTRSSKKFKDMNITLTNVKSRELLVFLKQKPLIRGRVTVKSYFELFSKNEKNGKAKIEMKKGFMPSVAPYVPFVLNSTIEVKNFIYNINGKIDSDIGSLKVKNGYYHKIQKEGHVEYDLDLKELSYFDEILKNRYKGSLNTQGKLEYKDKQLFCKGTTYKFDGILDYVYKKGVVTLGLKKLSLKKILKQLEYPLLLTAKVDGKVEYNIKEKIVMINTQLRETKFTKTKMTDMIFTATKIDMLSDTYDNSSFIAGYQNEQLSAVLKIDNGLNHIYLNNAILNRKTNSIDSDFDVRMQGQEIFGKIGGTLKHPSVSVDIKRLIKEQLEKKIDSLFGHSKTEKFKNELNILKGNIGKKIGNIFK